MAEKLYATATGLSNILSVQLVDSHVAQVANATIIAETSNVSIGDSITIALGYESSYNTLFTGYVKAVERKEPTRLYTISASNVLIRAMDYFIVASDPENTFTRQNIQAETLVGDILALAGITNYTSETTSFTFAIHTPLEVNITAAYDYAKFISSLLAWNLYGDKNGLVHFVDRKPYVMPGDSSLGTIGDATLTEISYMVSEKDLRNRIVVYGAGDIKAEAKASSPYLPSGFYKSVLVAAPDVIDTQNMANISASYNLTAYNRLTKRLTLTVVGNSSYEARQVYTIDKSDLGATGDWYVYGITHDWSSTGYTTSLDMRQ